MAGPIAYRLTTHDNPFDPFNQFSDWYRFDMEKGYDTCKYLARVARMSDDMTEQEEIEENNRAIDTIIKLDIYGIYKRVGPQSFQTTIN